MRIYLKRAYDKPARTDGCRILVDRLWPRGVSKQTAKIDLWARDAAPSSALRNWYHHDVGKWQEFKRRYYRELRAHPSVLAELRARVRAGPVTLIFASREPRFNNAAALKSFLQRS